MITVPEHPVSVCAGFRNLSAQFNRHLPQKPSYCGAGIGVMLIVDWFIVWALREVSQPL